VYLKSDSWQYILYFMTYEDMDYFQRVMNQAVPPVRLQITGQEARDMLSQFDSRDYRLSLRNNETECTVVCTQEVAAFLVLQFGESLPA